MSTKTSFKRVALVAVAALGLGVLSSVSASAAPSAAYTTMYDTALGTQVVGGNATVTLSLDTATVTNVTITGVGSVVSADAVDTQTISGCAVTHCVGAISFQDSTTRNLGNGDMTPITTKPSATVVLTSSVAGTTSITMTPLNSSGTPGTAVVKTVTWLGAAAGFVDHNSAYLSEDVATETSADPTTPTIFAATSSATPVALIVVRSYRAGDTTTVSTLADAGSVAVSASISGAGTIAPDAAAAGASTASGIRGAVATFAAASASGIAATNLWGSELGAKAFYVFPDGRTGTGTITITVGTSTFTKTVTFYGTTTKLVADPDNEDTPKVFLGVGDTQTINTMPQDATSNLGAATTVASALSSTTTVATIASVTQGRSVKVVVNGIALGTSTITVCLAVGAGGTCATGAITKTYTVTVTESTAKKVTMTFDKATYAPGEKMLLTVAATGTTGTKIADGSRTVFTTVPTANVANIGTLPATTAIALVGGEKTYTLYAPLVSGEVVVSATDNAATPVAITATATVAGGAGDAALDAANEATDAAYAAADAADNATQAAVDAGAAAALAQESADAALAAVTDLGIKVTGLLDALSKSLANIYKIIKAIQAKQK